MAAPNVAIRGQRSLLRQIREALAGGGPAQTRLDMVVRIIARSMVAEVCSLYMRRAQGEMELFATEGLDPNAVHVTRMKPGEGLVGDYGKLNTYRGNGMSGANQITAAEVLDARSAAAAVIPSDDAIMTSTALSVSQSRTSRAVPAPIAARTPSSVVRAVARANIRFATFAHARRRSSPVAASNTYPARRNVSSTSA